MLREGYWLFEYLPISRLIYSGPSKYGMAYLYTETDEFDVTYFLSYKAWIIAMAREQLREHISRKQQKMAHARQQFGADGRLNHRQRELLRRFARHDALVVTIQDHQGWHNVAYGTARSDLSQLAEWGYLVKAQVGNRFDYMRGSKLEHPA